MHSIKVYNNCQRCQLAILDIPVEFLDIHALLAHGCPMTHVSLNHPRVIFYRDLLQRLFLKLAKCASPPSGLIAENRNVGAVPGDVYEWPVGTGIEERYQRWLARNWLSDMSFFFDTKNHKNVFTIVLRAYSQVTGEDEFDD